MIHKGNAHGGHYYAFIKDFEDHRWYKFNDSTVTEIDVLDIISSFGEKPEPIKGRLNSFQQTENAYMVHYRQIDPDSEINTISDDLIEPCIIQEITSDIKDEKKLAHDREMKQNEMQLKVIFNSRQSTFNVNRKFDNLEYLLGEVLKEFELEAESRENCRLRAYNVVN